MSTPETRPTDVSDVPDGEPGSSDTARSPWYRDDRMLFRIVLALTIAPIGVAAVRQGLNGWVPTLDAAHTVLQAKYALTSDPALVGMYTDASNWIDAPTYFPGPWLLWWLSIPTRILGTSWGPLVAMAVLNSLWIALAGTCVARRFGNRTAMGTLVFLGLFIWTSGNQNLLSSTPMSAVVPPFAAFLFIAWALASGDDRSLPAFALVTNFLVLNHLTLVRIVPVIAGTALLLWIIGVVADHRTSTGDRSGRRRRIVRSTLGAAVTTVVLWIPPVIQELTHQPGNLTNLWRAGRAMPASPANWTRGYEALVGLFAAPPFWLRDSRSTNLLLSSPPLPGRDIAVATVVIAASIGMLYVFAIRRRDRRLFSAVVLSTIAFLVAWHGLAHPPQVTVLSVPVGYFLSTWPIAMFVTFTLAYGLLGVFRADIRARFTVPTVAVALVVMIANLPHANFTNGTYESSDEMIRAAKSMNPMIVSAVRGKGRVALGPRQIHTTPYIAALGVALDDAGIPFCLNGIEQWQDLHIPPCTGDDGEVAVTFSNTATLRADPNFAGTIIASHDPLDAAEHRELAALRNRVAVSIGAAAPLRLTRAAQDHFEALLPGPVDREQLATPEYLGGDIGPMVGDKNRIKFARLIDDLATSNRPVVAVRVPGLSDTDLRRWARLESKAFDYSISATMSPIR